MNRERRNRTEREQTKLEGITITDTSEIADENNRNIIKMQIEEIMSNIDSILDDEQDAFDNMPEGLQCSMRGETSEECIDCLSDALDSLQALEDMIDEFDADNADDFKDDFNDSIDDISSTLDDVIFS